MNTYAPVVVFVFKRLLETRATFNSLLKNPEAISSDLIVYVDRWRTEEERIEVQKVTEFVSTIKGFRSLTIIHRNTNYGLAESFICGISEILSRYDAAIFLEDDNLLSKDFLKYMNLALNEYMLNSSVLAVTGYSFPLIPKMKKPYFIHGAGTWSMGTWARSWELFESDAVSALQKVEECGLLSKMNMYGIDFYSMLKKQTKGEIDSWGVRWWATAVIHEMVTLYPGAPLCINIGGNAQGTHTLTSDPLMNKESNLSQNSEFVFPKSVKPSRMILIRFKLMNLSFSLIRLKKRSFRLLSRMRKIG